VVFLVVYVAVDQLDLYKAFLLYTFLIGEEEGMTKALEFTGEELATRKLIAFGWYGGKFSHLDWLLPLLPRTAHFCEPYGGSAAVLLNREPSPLETYNDLDGDVVNFFRVLRDKKEELIEKIGLTPFSCL